MCITFISQALDESAQRLIQANHYASEDVEARRKAVRQICTVADISDSYIYHIFFRLWTDVLNYILQQRLDEQG